MYLAALYFLFEDGSFRELVEAGRVHFEVTEKRADFGPAKEDWHFTHSAIIVTDTQGDKEIVLHRLIGSPIFLASGCSVTLQYEESPISEKLLAPKVENDRFVYQVGQWK